MIGRLIGGGSSGGLRKTLLWTNDAPTTSVTTLKVDIPDLSKYSYVSIVIRTSTTAATTQEQIIPVSIGSTLTISSLPTSSGNILVRKVGFAEDKITFGSGAATSVTGSNSARCIPLTICGIQGKFKE